jgi:hypothetical protein
MRRIRASFLLRCVCLAASFHVLVGRARKTGRPVDSIWFVDMDRKRRHMLDSFHDDTRDNPTIR